MKNLVRKTSSKDKKLAKEIMAEVKGNAVMTLRVGSKSVKLTKELTKLLTQIFSLMANDKSIAVVASEVELTTQEAADLLSFSRPYVVTLLEEGKIPFKKVGSHRRLRLQDVLMYKAFLKKNRRDVLRFLTWEAQDMGLYK
jgi:excisionase family DNA binding protein